MYIEYDKNGYIKIESLLACGMPFIFVTGGRGTGKTYGALKYILDSGRRCMWMRRTQTETDLINKPEFQPFKALNADTGRNIDTKKAAKGSAVFIDLDDPENVIGYTCALATISNMRGFDASDVELFVYDEFIPERHKAAIKEEGNALFNAYETLNRNRELQGRPPLQLLALSNSNRLDNEIFAALDIINICQDLKRNGEREYINTARGLAVFMLDNSPISEKKRLTALYKLTAGGTFSEMALDNQFADLAEHVSVKRNLREYIPLATVGRLAIYRHKSNRRYYVTGTRAGVFKNEFADTDKERLAFIRTYPLLYDAYLKRRIDFSDYASEAAFRKLY